jgi:hypothetical protein
MSDVVLRVDYGCACRLTHTAQGAPVFRWDFSGLEVGACREGVLVQGFTEALPVEAAARLQFLLMRARSVSRQLGEGIAPDKVRFERAPRREVRP